MLVCELVHEQVVFIRFTFIATTLGHSMCVLAENYIGLIFSIPLS